MQLAAAAAATVQAASIIGGATVLVQGLSAATFPTQETAAATMCAAIVLTGWSVAALIRHMAAPPANPPEKRQEHTPMNSDIRTAVVRATQDQLNEITRLTGIRCDLAEISDSDGIAFHEAGPSILQAIADHRNAQAPQWNDLNHSQQSAVVFAAASSPDWSQGKLDPYRIDQLLEEEPDLASMLQPEQSG